jgi:hypothetical protein
LPHKAIALQSRQNHGLKLFCPTSLAQTLASAKTCYAPATARATMFCLLSSEAYLLTGENNG